MLDQGNINIGKITNNFMFFSFSSHYIGILVNSCCIVCIHFLAGLKSCKAFLHDILLQDVLYEIIFKNLCKYVRNLMLLMKVATVVFIFCR